MISLLGSLLGFGSSLIGPVLDAWNRSADQKHELAMLHAQAQAILDAERLKRDRWVGLGDFVRGMCVGQ